MCNCLMRKTVDIKFSAQDPHPEQDYSPTLKVKRLV